MISLEPGIVPLSNFPLDSQRTRKDVNSRINFKHFVDYLVYLLVLLLVQIIYMLPEKSALALGRFVGRCGYVLLPDRRQAALENLTIAFGKEQSREWIVRTARKSFEHVGMLGIEFFLIRRWSEREMAERILLEGQLPFNFAMLPGNHGIILLTSHFGCFEVSAAATKFLGIKLNLIMTPLKNRFVSRYLFSRGGKESGVTTYGHKGVVKDMIRALRAGEMVAVLGDQRGDAERGVFVDYFGAKAPANEVFARLAIDGNAHILRFSLTGGTTDDTEPCGVTQSTLNSPATRTTILSESASSFTISSNSGSV